MAKQIPIGDELFGTPMAPAAAPQPSVKQPSPDLEEIQADSEKQALPDQEKVFRVAGRVRSKLNNLPDPTKPPLGFVPGRGFDVVFPFVKLPHLAPNLNGDWVQFGSPDLEPNRLYYGDNLQVLRTLPSNSIDLIYIDPPFFSGAEYNVIWGDTNEVRTFSDIWEGGLDTYLIWLNARLWEMYRVLKNTGSIYVHCDWHASHYIKSEMDKLPFGYENFRNEIIWFYGGKNRRNNKNLGYNHNTVLFYAKAPGHTLVESALPWSRDEYLRMRKQKVQVDENGREYVVAGGFGDISQGQGKLYLDDVLSLGRPLPSVWEIPQLTSSDKERMGYPTQKPEALLERIINASSKPGDIVADFFCGGGVTPAVAQKLGRRWIACDSSRVAVSVTLNRVVQIGEEQSGVISNYGKAGQVQAKMDLPTPEDAVPDIRVHYVGVYPMDRFKAIDQAQFDSFVLACLAAQADNSDNAITGWRSAREPLRVGPADPDASPDAGDVKAFFEAVLSKLQPNVRTVARYVCWRISPELKGYRRKLSDYVRRNIEPRGADLDFDFLLIDSEEFRERIRQKYPDADDNEFLLKFTKEPVIAEVAATRLGPRRYSFEARDADSTNIGGYLVNCQWDFDYNRGHFAADAAYVLCRTEMKGKEAKAAGHKFEAVLTAEHTFESAGTRTVACRVQDNLGAEVVRTLTIEVA